MNEINTTPVDSIVTESEDDKVITVATGENTEKVVIDTYNGSTFSPLDSGRLRITDLYRDARTLLQKTNSTKFIVTAYSLLAVTALLMLGYIDPDVYKDMTLVLTLSYLGADVVEKGVMINKSRKM